MFFLEKLYSNILLFHHPLFPQTVHQYYPPSCSGLTNLIMSSILRIVMAASVANLSDLTLDIDGSSTPAFRLLRILPFVRSSPEYLNCFCSSVASYLMAALWKTRSLATRSVASFAAFKANVFGII